MAPKDCRSAAAIAGIRGVALTGFSGTEVCTRRPATRLTLIGISRSGCGRRVSLVAREGLEPPTPGL
jgi:hypothetical protein